MSEARAGSLVDRPAENVVEQGGEPTRIGIRNRRDERIADGFLGTAAGDDGTRRDLALRDAVEEEVDRDGICPGGRVGVLGEDAAAPHCYWSALAVTPVGRSCVRRA